MNNSTKPIKDFTDNENFRFLENYLVITTVNKNYLKIFDIWWHYFQRTKYKSKLKVITLDKESDRFISDKGIESIYIGKSSRNFSKIILWRFETIFKLLQQGKNIIHTDADAFWINPQLDSIVNEKFDIQVSIAYGIPTKAVENWGFTLCTGFMILQSNPKVLSFVKSWVDSCAEIKDDQISFNNLLLNEGVKWELTDNTRNFGHNVEYGLNIEALPVDLVSRKVRKNLAIYHPYLPSNHQNFKVFDLIKRLRSIDNNPYLHKSFMKTLTSPLGWINSTYGWIAIMFFKAKKRATNFFATSR